MQDENKNINLTNEELLEKFLRHKLSDGERFELEKRALDDPFLFDALEGFTLNPTDTEADFKNIDKRIQSQIPAQEQKKKYFPLWRVSGIAAVLLMLFAALFLLDQYIWNPNENHLVKQTATEVEVIDKEEEALAGSEFQQFDNGEDSKGISDNNGELSKSSTEPLTKKQAIASTQKESPPQYPGSVQVKKEKMAIELSETAVIAELPEIEDQITITSEKKNAEEKDNAREYTMPDIEIDAPAFEEALFRDEPVRVGNSYVEGKVQDASGKPVMGAEVQAKNSAKSAKTDSAGNFSLDLTDPKDEIVVTSAGYNRAQGKISGATKMDVTLNNGSVLSEVNIESSNSYNNAFPEMGLEAFAEFVFENQIKPNEAIQAGISGTVSIEFTVGSYGKLSDFRILQSLGYGCDKEAIRLLKASGSWETFPKYKTMKTVYNFTF
jgi:TonB family protein